MSQEFIDVIARHPRAITLSEAKKEYLSMSPAYQASVSEAAFVDYLANRRRDNILWHDYEAGGTDAKSVQPLQFAAIRTDKEHRPIDLPIDIYCQMAGDKLPHPVAIAITKINPMLCQSDGLPEPAFFRQIESEMSVPASCVAGYNSMGYDEEVTRFGLWRNLLPVYDREFSNFNSRWDLLPVTAAYCAMNVDEVVWPKREDGEGISLKLEHLASANAITQESAHNALDDVRALIHWSKKLIESNPDLWNYFFDNRRKKNMASMLHPGATGVLFSAQFGYAKQFCSPVLVLGTVPGESNKCVGVDLRDIEGLRACWRLTVDEIRERLFSKKEALLEKGVSRPPLQTFAINKSPAFVSEQWCQEHLVDTWREEWSLLAEKVMASSVFVEKLRNVFMNDDFDDTGVDIEMQLYGQGFPSERDKKNIMVLRGEKLSSAFSQALEWDNPLYATLWHRARCKLDGSYDVVLSSGERKGWEQHCAMRRESLPDSTKHEQVNMQNVIDVLESTDMDTALKEGYHTWLSSL